MVAASATMVAMAGSQEAVEVKLNLKEGQSYSSKMTASIDFQGMTINASGTNVTTVKAVKDGTYTLISETKNLVIDLGGQTMEQPDSSITMTQNQFGKIISVEGDMVTEESSRLQNAFNFFYPSKAVKVGEKWDTTVPADKERGTPELKSSYEVVERKEWKGKDVLVFKVSQSEVGTSPISIDGTFAVEIKTGIPVMTEFTFKNLPQAGMLMDGTWKTEATE